MAGVTIVFADDTALKLDAVTSQSHQREADVTENPVEKGKDVSDHVRAKPQTLTIEAIQSDTPIVPEGEEPEANRHMAAYTRLMKAWQAGEILKVHTGLEVYTSMVIASLSMPRDGKHGHALRFNASFRAITTAEATTTTVKVPKTAIGTGTTAAKKKTQAQATPKTAKGKKPTRATTAAEARISRPVKEKSWAVQIRGALGGG